MTANASMEESRAAVETVRLYLDAFYNGDFEHARETMADDFSFRGPFVEVEGRDAFLASAEGLRSVVKGHRVLRQWVDGGDVASVYEVAIETEANAGSITMSEWHVFRDGALVSGRVLFDSAALRSLIAAG